MPDFTVVEGGGGEREFREARHALSLWNAIYPQAAKDYKEIATRMRVSIHTVNNTIYHVRQHAENYGWTIPHVQKGPSGEHRSIFPVMLNDNSPSLRSAKSQQCLRAGAQSSCLTIATMSEHEAVALEAASGALYLTGAQKRKLRTASTMFSAAARMATEVLGQIINVA